MYGKTFWMSFVLFVSAMNLFNLTWILLLGMTFAVLGEKRNDFGKQTLWGSIGAITTSVISAITMNKYGSSTNEITFTPCFIGFGICTILTGISTMSFKLEKIPNNPSIIKDILKLLKQPQICFLLTTFFIMGFLHVALEMFLFVFLRELNASSWVLGGCLLMRFLGEIPTFYFSGTIMNKVGYVRCLYIAFIVFALRFVGTSLIPNPWWELPLSFVKSLVLGLGYAAVSVYGSLITPPSMHATLQSVVQLMYNGFGTYQQHFIELVL